MTYNRDLANRFVNDYKLPVPLINKEEYFNYYLNLYEKDYGALTKYNKLIQTINGKFDGNIGEFLDEYYQVRENIIQSLLNNPAYIEFNEKIDMNKFAVKDKPDVTKNNIYHQDNANKYFISVDLKRANFQALKYVNPEIVLNTDTYEDFIGKFTDLDYMKKSKYTRQVVFGKINPKRQITVEKYIINEVRKCFEEWINMDCLKLVSMSNDELVYELVVYDIEDFRSNYVWGETFKIATQKIKDITGFDVRIELFKLEGYQLIFKESRSVSKTFYYKNCIIGKNKLVAIPLPFFPITYKLFNKMELYDIDYHFNYEGMDAVLNEEFDVVAIK